jgi:hypothetical protein
LELRSIQQEGSLDSQLGPIHREILSELRANLAAEDNRVIESMKKIGMSKPYLCFYFDMNKTFKVGQHEK